MVVVEVAEAVVVEEEEIGKVPQVLARNHAACADHHLVVNVLAARKHSMHHHHPTRSSCCNLDSRHRRTTFHCHPRPCRRASSCGPTREVPHTSGLAQNFVVGLAGGPQVVAWRGAAERHDGQRESEARTHTRTRSAGGACMHAHAQRRADPSRGVGARRPSPPALFLCSCTSPAAACCLRRIGSSQPRPPATAAQSTLLAWAIAKPVIEARGCCHGIVGKKGLRLLPQHRVSTNVLDAAGATT